MIFKGGDGQLWRFVPDRDYYKIVDEGSGKCLEFLVSSNANGVEVVRGSPAEGTTDSLSSRTCGVTAAVTLHLDAKYQRVK